MIWKLLEQAVVQNPNGVATREGIRSRNWQEIQSRVTLQSALLSGTGLQPGDRVALLAPNGAGFLEATFAVAHAGAILVPLNLRLSQREQVAVLRDAEPKLLLVAREKEADGRGILEQSGLGTVLQCLPREDQEAGESGTSSKARMPRVQGDPAFLYYTSGTTGKAKGVVLTHGNVVSHARNAVKELELCASDCWAHIAPMFHLADAWATLAVTAVGGSHVFLPQFDAGQALRLMDEEGVTLTNLVPTMLNDMTHHKSIRRCDLSSLRLLLSGGAPIAPSLVQEVEEAFRCTYAQTYGLTETSPYLTISLLDERHRDRSEEDRRAARSRTGRPFFGVEVEVVDEKGQVVPQDDQSVGEVRARGATVTPGYWRRPKATAEALREGWFYTSDLAVVDADGSLRIVDRKKDMILTGGECVYSIEVESVLQEYEDVYEAAAFGLPDPRWGEAVHAAVVPKPGCELQVERLKEFCRERLANYKVPKRFHVLDAMPRLGSGKLAKRLLREQIGLD